MQSDWHDYIYVCKYMYAYTFVYMHVWIYECIHIRMRIYNIEDTQTDGHFVFNLHTQKETKISIEPELAADRPRARLASCKVWGPKNHLPLTNDLFVSSAVVSDWRYYLRVTTITANDTISALIGVNNQMITCVS